LLIRLKTFAQKSQSALAIHTWEVNVKPRIGINLDVRKEAVDKLVLSTTYHDAILNAGGVPVLIPPVPTSAIADLVQGLSALVLTGGKDYHPALYGEEPCGSVELAHPIRQDFDLSLIKYCINNTRMPILGICAGHQLLNISLGGSLIQDIESDLPTTEIKHSSFANQSESASAEMNKHAVSIEQNSLLHSIYGKTRITATSSHHQAVQRLGRGLKVSARSDDGLIEAIELPGRPFTVGVQWHPERDINNHDLLFDALIEAAKTFSGTFSNYSSVFTSCVNRIA
jgi:putative glutamine amidotransferase